MLYDVHSLGGVVWMAVTYLVFFLIILLYLVLYKIQKTTSSDTEANETGIQDFTCFEERNMIFPQKY